MFDMAYSIAGQSVRLGDVACVSKRAVENDSSLGQYGGHGAKVFELDLGDERLNAILQSMSASLQFSHDNENTQLRLPADNPILSLVLMARALMREVPLLIIVENVQLCHSHIPLVFLLAAMQDAQQTRTMVVLHSTILNDDTVASFRFLLR